METKWHAWQMHAGNWLLAHGLRIENNKVGSVLCFVEYVGHEIAVVF